MEKTIKQNLIVKLQKWSKVIRANLFWKARLLFDWPENFALNLIGMERHLVSIN